MSRMFQALSIVLQVLTWSVHQEPFGIALRKRCSCSSLSCPYFAIQWLNSFFQVEYDLRPPSHVGTGRRCRLFKLGFDPKVSAILVTADVIVDIDDVKASKVSEFVDISAEFSSF